MTAQDLLNRVVAGLAAQDWERAVVVDTTTVPRTVHCRYRGGGSLGNRCCAIGVLLTDEDYVPELEGVGVNKILRDSSYATHAWRIAKLRPADLTMNQGEALLEELQQAHDRVDPTGKTESEVRIILRANLSDVARRWRLKQPPELLSA